ncbi:hypothetical protein BSU00_08765 [Tenacibaculum sp. SG-28]|nr:hypothetical protein BSU00_08765 [Tenacibaculum sp. SG-28]
MTKFLINNKKESIFFRLSVLVLFLLAILSIIPTFRAFSFFNYLWATSLICYVALIFFDDSSYFLHSDTYKFSIFFFIFYTIFIPILFGNNEIGNRFFELSQLPIYFIAFDYNNRKGRIDKNIKIIKSLIPVIVIISLITVLEYRDDPSISRALKSSKGIGTDKLLKGVGGYDFIYFLVFFCSILIFNKRLIKFKNKAITSVFYFFTLLLFTTNIFLSNFSTAFLLISLAIFLRFLGKKYPLLG